MARPALSCRPPVRRRGERRHRGVDAGELVGASSCSLAPLPPRSASSAATSAAARASNAARTPRIRRSVRSASARARRARLLGHRRRVAARPARTASRAACSASSTRAIAASTASAVARGASLIASWGHPCRGADARRGRPRAALSRPTHRAALGAHDSPIGILLPAPCRRIDLRQPRAMPRRSSGPAASRRRRRAAHASGCNGNRYKSPGERASQRGFVALARRRATAVRRS